jgi:hypothetical protein
MKALSGRRMVAMTELLERAIARLKNLPAREQDAISSIILEELEDDLRWDKPGFLTRG